MTSAAATTATSPVRPQYVEEAEQIIAHLNRLTGRSFKPTPAAVAQVRRMIQQHRPEVLVLDPARSFFAGDENDSGEVGAFLATLDEVCQGQEVCRVVIHHASKTGDSRGSTALTAWARAVFRLEGSETDSEIVTVSHAKANDVARLDRFTCRLPESGFFEITETATSKRGRDRQYARSEFAELFPTEPGSISYEDARNAAEQQLGIKKWTFDRLRLELLQTGQLKKDVHGQYVRAQQ